MSSLCKNILHHAKQQLTASGIASALLDADLLMAHILHTSRESVIAYPERQLTPSQAEQFQVLLARRLAREPMAHLLGKREFWGREFIVTRDTLDPRPDSETLIDAVLNLYQDRNKILNILDFGSGTGCLLLTLLAEFPQSSGLAVDISPAALEVVKRNAAKLGLAKRCQYVVSSWGREVAGSFDLIVSNPPYIPYHEIAGLEPEVALYEPGVALDGGETGLECYQQLAPYISSLLSENGYAALEIGAGQQTEVRNIMEQAGLRPVSSHKDLAGIIRCLVFSK